jgi:ABC-2 type transport system permease protein
MFVMLFCAQVIAALGFGQHFPWSVPGLYAGIAGPGSDPPGALGFALVLATGTAGVLATVLWWRAADHTR